jgi:hypothetical protein
VEVLKVVAAVGIAYAIADRVMWFVGIIACAVAMREDKSWNA